MYVFGSGRCESEEGEWISGFGFYQSVGTRGVLDVCLCLGCSGVSGVGGELVADSTSVWEGGVVLCMCVL